MSPILEVAKLTKEYPSNNGTLVVLRDVSFLLEEGGRCAIVGPSGSGKTTLLGLCAGLDRASRGSVKIAGRELSSLSEDERAALRSELIGFVFQNFQLLPTLTALENVMVPLELRGDAGSQDLALDLLRRVGLFERRHHYPIQLSGGEQQRVALARAFINRPKILFADEPTGNLDDETSRQIIGTIFELNRSSGTALVLVTHNLELAQQTGRIIRLKNGAKISDDPA
jgi:putative ABC transport system ATP-binding protein